MTRRLIPGGTTNGFFTVLSFITFWTGTYGFLVHQSTLPTILTWIWLAWIRKTCWKFTVITRIPFFADALIRTTLLYTLTAILTRIGITRRGTTRSSPILRSTRLAVTDPSLHANAVSVVTACMGITLGTFVHLAEISFIPRRTFTGCYSVHFLAQATVFARIGRTHISLFTVIAFVITQTITFVTIFLRNTGSSILARIGNAVLSGFTVWSSPSENAIAVVRGVSWDTGSSIFTWIGMAHVSFARFAISMISFLANTVAEDTFCVCMAKSAPVIFTVVSCVRSDALAKVS